MLYRSLKTFSTGMAILLLLTTVMGQAPERNLTIPPTVTTTSSAPLQTSGANTPTNSTNTPTTNGTTVSNSTIANNNTASNANTTTPVKLTPVPDATGPADSVPMPASSGGKANGRYGPDDEYIASSVVKVAVPIFSTFFIMSCTVGVISYGAFA